MSKQEKMLCLLLLVGLACIVLDPFSYRWDMLVPGKHHKKAITVDFILILSNIPAALFFSFNKMLMLNRVVKHILVVNLMMMIIFIVMAVLYDDAQLNFHQEVGLFGWLNERDAVNTIFMYGFIATFWG
jgi:hypothetical protein